MPVTGPNLPGAMTALMRIEKTSRYRPVAIIGRGGMAEAVLALLDAGGVSKVVVLKRIWPDLGTDPDFVTMFHDEARLAIHLNHPNVVHTLEVVRDAEQLAIAMEYCTASRSAPSSTTT
jgi:eukaryotic-like serine/threonine-protein kinase